MIRHAELARLSRAVFDEVKAGRILLRQNKHLVRDDMNVVPKAAVFYSFDVPMYVPYDNGSRPSLVYVAESQTPAVVEVGGERCKLKSIEFFFFL